MTARIGGRYEKYGRQEARRHAIHRDDSVSLPGRRVPAKIVEQYNATVRAMKWKPEGVKG